MELDILAQIPRLVKETISIFTEPEEKRRERRIEFFGRELAPIHEAMTVIHADYAKSFADLANLLETEADLPTAIKLLKKKRLVLIAQRKEVMAFSGAALKEIQRGQYIRHRQVKPLVEFAEAIRDYFRAASPVDVRVTWYTDFIAEFEDIVRRQKRPSKEEFKTIESGAHPVVLVKRALADALHEDIPEAWKRYSAAFAQLRLVFAR